MYETMQRTTRRLPQVLKWLGVAVLGASCALLVYMGAILLARLAVWAFFP